MVFSSHTDLLQDFTTSRAPVAAAIAKAAAMESKDGTFIHEDMYEAVQEALNSKAAGSRRVLVWFTDGTSNFENSWTQKTIGRESSGRLHSRQEATDSLLKSQVVTAALIQKSAATDALVLAVDANPLAMIFGARTGDIRRYADLTGGPVVDTSKNEVADRLGSLLDEIRGRYTLGYKPSSFKPAGAFCRIQLEIAADALRRLGVRKSEIVVRTRVGYYR